MPQNQSIKTSTIALISIVVGLLVMALKIGAWRLNRPLVGRVAHLKPS